MSDAADVLLRLRGVAVHHGEVRALDGVDLVVRAGERVALVGPSGAGKSTLLGVANVSVRASRGEVEVLGANVAVLGERELSALRRRIGTVHQRLNLVGPLRVVHNVNAGRLGAWSRRRALWSLVRPQATAEAAEALARMGVRDKLFTRTDRLSGGEAQRVALARLVVQDPDLVLADEPVSSLDPARAAEVMELLGSLVHDRPRALVVSLHSFDLARRCCDRVVGLQAGRVVFDLPAAEVEAHHGTELYRISA